MVGIEDNSDNILVPGIIVLSTTVSNWSLVPCQVPWVDGETFLQSVLRRYLVEIDGSLKPTERLVVSPGLPVSKTDRTGLLRTPPLVVNKMGRPW